MSNVEYFREQLNSGDAIALIWTVNDVQTVRPRLTDAQAREVLARVLRGHDASEGVNWATLKDAADDLFPA